MFLRVTERPGLRVVASALLFAFLIAGIPVTTPAQGVRGENLMALCRLWNAVRFFHPALANVADARWDDALLAAEPVLEADPTALRRAADVMLAALNDPLTTTDFEKAGTRTAMPSGSDELSDVHIVRVNGNPGESGTAAYAKALAAAFTLPEKARALVVDLRIGAAPAFNEIDRVFDAWQQLNITSYFIAAPIIRTSYAQRYFLGLPTENGFTTGGYIAGRETLDSETAVAPAASARAVPIAFVVDATAIIPPDAVALERAGSAALFSSDGTSGILPGVAQRFVAGNGLTAVLRTSAPLPVPHVRYGGLDEALAWARNPSTLPIPVVAPSPALPIARRYADTALPDVAHRMLAAFRMWGSVAYLHAYPDLRHDDWDTAARSGFAELHAAQTSLEYELALQKMYAHIHDSHGFMSAPATRIAFGATPEFLARDLEGKATIVRVDPATARRDGFAVGDVIEAVDGETIDVRRARLRPYIAASTEQAATESLNSGVGQPALFAGPAGSVATLRLHTADGHIRTVRTTRAPANARLSTRTRPAIDVLAGNIGYIDLQRLTIGEVDSALARLASTRAIVLDLRGYPRGTAWKLAPHFASQTVPAALFRTPVRRVPVQAPDAGGSQVRYLNETRDFDQIIEPEAPRYAKPVVVVIDSRAISQAEHTGLYLAAAAHARFVGEPTMGANGDVTSYYLPGGITASFSGQAVLHPDGTQLQRIGLIPDVRVSPTLRGVREGRDELLLAGVREALRVARVDDATAHRALAQETADERADAKTDVLPPPPIAVAPDTAPAMPDTFREFGDQYEGGHDPQVRHASGRTIFLRAKGDPLPSVSGSYSVRIPADDYRNKRVRVSGYVRSENATNASFWLRIDGPGNRMEVIDSMNGRELVGTRDWSPFAIVLDVPSDAQILVGGLYLAGHGSLWADDLRIDVVGTNVPTTDQ